MIERERLIQQELRDNQEYMKKVMLEADQDKQRHETKLKQYKVDLRENQRFVLDQIDSKTKSPFFKKGS